MYDDLKGKVALVTGSGREKGMGFAIASKLAGNGANVCLADLPANHDDLMRLSEKIRREHGVEVLGLDLDVTAGSSIDDAYQAVCGKFKGLDILVNNAGTVFGAPSTVVNYDEESWMKTMDVNLHGVLRVSKKFYPEIAKRKGAIVNVASTAGKGPHALASAYGVSKVGVIMLTKVMAKECAAAGVRVNAICPGLIMTDLMTLRFELEAKAFGGTPKDSEERLKTTVPLQRIGNPSEVASLVAFLVSKESSYITGQAINICGGRTMEL